MQSKQIIVWKVVPQLKRSNMHTKMMKLHKDPLIDYRVFSVFIELPQNNLSTFLK